MNIDIHGNDFFLDMYRSRFGLGNDYDNATYSLQIKIAQLENQINQLKNQIAQIQQRHSMNTRNKSRKKINQYEIEELQTQIEQLKNQKKNLQKMINDHINDKTEHIGNLPPNPPQGMWSFGRKLYKGPRGGIYYKKKGRKVYVK